MTTQNNIDLTNRIALITGASRGIGASVAKAYAKAGAHVILVARTIGGLEEVDDEIQSFGGKTTLIPQDLGDLDALDTLGPAIAEKFGRLDILVGNAGMLGTLGPLTHTKTIQWDKIITVNVNANFRLLRTLEPLLQASDAGRAIFVTSGMADICEAYWGAYATTKAALNAMVKVYAAETRQTNLRVNLLSPGTTDTKMLAEAYPGGFDGDVKSPEETVQTFLELASPQCALHGKIIQVPVNAAKKAVSA